MDDQLDQLSRPLWSPVVWLSPSRLGGSGWCLWELIAVEDVLARWELLGLKLFPSIARRALLQPVDAIDHRMHESGRFRAKGRRGHRLAKCVARHVHLHIKAGASRHREGVGVSTEGQKIATQLTTEKYDITCR